MIIFYSVGERERERGMENKKKLYKSGEKGGKKMHLALSREMESNPPATYRCMKPNNQLLFLGSKAFMLQIRPQVISPPKPATLPTSPKS